MEISLTGKTAVLIGGSKGLGFGMAEGVARAGANVVIVSRHQDQLDEAAAKLRDKTSNENITGIAADITSIENINTLVEKVCERYGQIDILFNGAGVNRRLPKKKAYILSSECRKKGRKRGQDIQFSGSAGT